MSPAIEEVDLYRLSLPLSAPFSSATSNIARKDVLIARLGNNQGQAIWSECVALPAPTYTRETVSSCIEQLKQRLIPAVKGRAYPTVEALHNELVHIAPDAPMARAVLEMGAWALTALEEQTSLVMALGDTLHPVPCGYTVGQVNDDAQFLSHIQQAIAIGATLLKVKVYPNIPERQLALLAKYWPKNRYLLADANGSYDEPGFSGFRRLREVGVDAIEQPFSQDYMSRHQNLVKNSPLPILLDDSIGSLTDAEHAIAQGHAHGFSIKPGRLGGFTEATRLVAYCQKNQYPYVFGGMLETGIGRAYLWAYAASHPCDIGVDFSGSGRYWTRDIVTPEWQVEAGTLLGDPTAPGLGVQVIDDVMAQGTHIA